MNAYPGIVEAVPLPSLLHTDGGDVVPSLHGPHVVDDGVQCVLRGGGRGGEERTSRNTRSSRSGGSRISSGGGGGREGGRVFDSFFVALVDHAPHFFVSLPLYCSC